VAFSILITQQISPLNTYLFIDGVDKYNGDHVKLIRYLDKLTLACVKFILLSRPAPLCVKAFASCPSFRLQDFTRPDIASFMGDRLRWKGSFAAIASKRPEEVETLYKEIVDKASGMFLWVILVVKALLMAADNLDRIADLRARVDKLPANLDKLYAEMLAQMETVYRRQTAMLLQIMYQSTRVSSKKPMDALRLSFAIEADADVDVAIDAQICPLTAEEVRRRCQVMQAMIRSRCCGLLETNAESRVQPGCHRQVQRIAELVASSLALPHDVEGSEDANEDADGNRKESNEDSVGGETGMIEVHFLYKSVIDFLEQLQV